MKKYGSHRCYTESIGIVALILMLSLILFRRYIFEGYYFLSQGVASDTLRANLPTYIQMYDGIFLDHNFWSWKMGIGTSMFTHADVYFDPFVYILFLKGRSGIPAMLIWMMIIKLMAEGLTMSMYLHYFKLKSGAVIIASTMYAFCGYSLIMGNNFALGTILVYVPLVCLGIEKWLDENKKAILLISLFLICIYSYYFFFSFGLLSTLYLSVRAKQKHIRIIPKLVSFAIIAVIVIGLSSFSVLPQVKLVLASDRVAGAKDVETGIELFIPQFRVLATAMARTLSNDLLGNRVTTEYWGYAYNWNKDYFQICTYVSSIFIILIGQLWENRKEYRKRLFFIFVGTYVLILFPVFSYIFNAFSTINARWMFFISFLQCIAVGWSLDSIIKSGRLKIKAMLVSIFISYVTIFLSVWIVSLDNNARAEIFGYNLHLIKETVIYISLLFCLLLALTLGVSYLQRIEKTTRYILILGFLGILVVDLYVNYYNWYTSENSVCKYTAEEKSSYEDMSATVISSIMEKDRSWYRIEKDFDSVYDDDGIPSDNDAMVQRYYGLKSYNSLNNSNYSAFLKELGIYVAVPNSVEMLKEMGVSPKEVTGPSLNYINGTYDRYNVMSYLGVKYYICDEKRTDLPQYLKLMGTKDELWIYQNECYLPLAFVNNKVLSEEQFQNLSYEEKEHVLYEYTIIDNELIANSHIILSDFEENTINKQKNFELKSFSQDRIEFTINADRDGYLNMTIPYDEDWHIYIDGKQVETECINVGLLGCKIGKGEHEIVIKYTPKSFIAGIIISSFTFCCIIFLRKRIDKFLKNLTDDYRVWEM